MEHTFRYALAVSSGLGDEKECEACSECGEGSGRYRHEGKAVVPRSWDLILWETGSQAGGAVSSGIQE